MHPGYLSFVLCSKNYYLYLPVLSFKAILQKTTRPGEKNGWTYVDIPLDVIAKLKLKSRREFRIKGAIDDVTFERLACYPVKDGNFIIAIKAEFRKKLGKTEGAMVSIKLELDTREALPSKELLDCLKEEPEALAQFSSLTKAHQNYFHAYVNSAKGADTRAGRIVNTITALLKKQNFGEMIRSHQKKNLNS